MFHIYIVLYMFSFIYYNIYTFTYGMWIVGWRVEYVEHVG